MSACTYSFNDFNTTVKIAVLQQRPDWEVPQRLKAGHTRKLHIYQLQ